MGGQACILYGAAEFSRDADFAILASKDNFGRLQAAMNELKAEVVAVPPFDPRFLERGHAIHFRCGHPDTKGFRVDVMVKLRGVDPFPKLWARRTTWEIGHGNQVNSLSLPDLVASKKTQRDKDWPMIRRLVEASYVQSLQSPTSEQILFWLEELRTPELLADCVERFPTESRNVGDFRPAVQAAIAGKPDEVVEALDTEEAVERNLDRAYWAPLKAELEQLRHDLSRRK